MKLTRRAFTVAALAAPFAGAARAQTIPLSEISAYMNALTTLTARFRQDNPDGSVTNGTFYLKRPGRMRFEYDPPEQAKVIAGGGALVIFDPRSDEPTRYPLNQTPLSVILSRNVNLSDEREITGTRESNGFTVVRAADPDNPEYGTIELVFSTNPVELRQWIVRDGAGEVTRVSLGELNTGTRVPDRLFNISAETRQWDP
ncbi:MAG: outer membrane lipoprotein carrier protein LolA [Pseudomonadota bacterium]